ncbi:hypothetical protein KAS50_01970, partial [bacterium]|nr:hypothetical protein [bacterium]
MLRKYIALFILIIAPQAAFGADLQIKMSSDYQKGNISYHQYLVNRAYLIFAPDKLEQAYPGLEMERAVKSGTGIIVELKENWDILSNDEKNFFSQFIAARPALNYEHISPSGQFKVHYNLLRNHRIPNADNDLNGVPDYAEQVALALDKARALYVDTLGFLPPYPDNGDDGPEFDVYLKNLSTVYGMTYFPTNVYMEIENDFAEPIFYTKGVNGALVTAAHELHHAVQFSYIVRSQDFFFYEVTATFMEDMVFDEINDYYQYLPSFFRYTQTPFTTRDGFHEYGLCIFGHFLNEKYGRSIMTEIWDMYKNKIPILNVLDNILNNYGSSFNEALNDFHLWNYFTGTRADPERYYEEGAYYPEIERIKDVMVTKDTTVSISNNHLTSSYILFNGLIPDSYEVSAKTTDNALIDLWSNS